MSLQDFLPQQLSYIGPRLRGQATTFQQWIIYPLSSNQFWQTNAIVKLASNINTGLVDWYRSHIQATVQVPLSLCPVGGVQIDNSAFGMISQMVITHQGYQIQRIMQYDTILAYLCDIGFSQWVCESRQSQGLGYINIPSQSAMSTTKRQLSSSIQLASSQSNNDPLDGFLSYQQTFSNGYSPTLTPINQGTYQANFKTTAPYAGTNITTGKALQSGTKNTHQSYTNIAVMSCDSALAGAAGRPTINIVNNLKRGPNLRAQYKYYINKNQYPDSPDSNTLINPRIKNQTWDYSTWDSKGFNVNSPYQIDFGTGVNPLKTYLQAANLNNTKVHSQQPCGVSGYAKPLCAQFCTGGFQPMLSPTIPQCQMAYGVIQNTPVPISKRRYRMPLASSICGVLIPPDQFRLIPAGFYQNLILQLTLNPYWMFTTGLNDVHQFDQDGMNNQIKRKWYYSQINWTWHIYTMNNQQLMQRVQAQLYKPIQFSSKSWQLLAQYQLPTGSYVKQTNQIPCNTQSLAQIVVIFLSNQYLKYSYCRKQFRLSNNITQMQLRANTIYYPIQPIVGNAGNPQMIDQTGDNWPYYQLILLSNNFLFNTNIPQPKINKKNFAINSRIYDASNNKPLYNRALCSKGKTAYNYNQMQSVSIVNVNADTAMGQSWFHQNRYIGKAAFTYSFQPYGHSKTLVNGVNTIGWKQFQISFNNSTVNQFPSDQTQYIFGQANVLIKMQVGRAIKVMGL